MPRLLRWFALVFMLTAFSSAAIVQAAQALTQSESASAFELIAAMNTLRTSNGLPALIEDPIIDAVAQATAKTMADNLMSWHIGDVSGRLAAAGYGGGATVWATENFAVGTLSIDQVMVIWSDAAHMIPAVNPAYCHVGAGTAKAPNGRTYYVLQAAYTSGEACGPYESSGGDNSGGESGSGWIVPVKVATPDEDGLVYHVVETGQSLWAIAVAYHVTIQDLEIWNNISKDFPLQVGLTLFIPGPDTKGYSTPTPVGMVQLSAPDADGKIIHSVQEYQTLTTISQAYGVGISTILTLNGIQLDWPLRIGQQLVIDPGSVTPSPTLSPIEQLTPANDGNYYHIVRVSETLTWIADLYQVTVAQLMTWNGLNESSILQPGQQLLLHVTPPVTKTPVSSPVFPTLTPVPSTPTPSKTPALPATLEGEGIPSDGDPAPMWPFVLVLLVGGSALVMVLRRRAE